MEHKYKRDTLLRNKISGNICKLNWDTSFIDENIWESWKPREGEWCWFCNKNDIEYGISPHIGKYGYLSYTLEYYDFCEPYTKNLPFNLDKQK